jgi:hypothetical protein
MALDEREWRPITFQGVTFPATLMAISILEPILGITDREFSDWVWGLDVCRGRTRNAPAKFCARMAQRTMDLMLEHRQLVLDGIRARCVPHGFDAEETYRDWMLAMQQIVNLSKDIDGDCVWSAPSHPKDGKPAHWKRLGAALDRVHEKFLQTGHLDVTDGSKDSGNPSQPDKEQ